MCAGKTRLHRSVTSAASQDAIGLLQDTDAIGHQIQKRMTGRDVDRSGGERQGRRVGQDVRDLPGELRLRGLGARPVNHPRRQVKPDDVCIGAHARELDGGDAGAAAEVDYP